MKQRIENMDLKDKRVVVRCDYNVPIQNGIILDDTKIIESLETIRYLIKNNCKIIILSHLGKIRTEQDKLVNSLEPVAKRLKELVGREDYFNKEVMDEAHPEQIQMMHPKDILLLENTIIL